MIALSAINGWKVGEVGMTDRKKVIKGLEYCKHTDGVECPNCPYWHEDDCVEILHADTLALLKEQEETEFCDRCGRRRVKSNREVK